MMHIVEDESNFIYLLTLTFYLLLRLIYEEYSDEYFNIIMWMIVKLQTQCKNTIKDPNQP